FSDAAHQVNLGHISGRNLEEARAASEPPSSVKTPPTAVSTLETALNDNEDELEYIDGTATEPVNDPVPTSRQNRGAVQVPAKVSDTTVSALPLAPTPTHALVVPSPEDARFIITVYGPQEDQEAKFRTRAGHKVKTVLENVCKTFGISHERARLVLEVNVKGKQRLRECHPEETIGSCGIVDVSRLLLQVDGVSEDDEDEE
ncbi:hypothetical protein H0H92_013720, partial [Tricholoma furcatifolium]